MTSVSGKTAAPSSPYGAIIFDLDGTLVDSAHVIGSLLNQMRAERNKPALARASYAAWISLGAEELLANALEIGPAEVTAALAQFRQTYRHHDTPLSTIYPGVVAMLRGLQHDGVRLAVCTNKPRALADKVLTDTGLLGYFEFVLAGDDLASKKPDRANLITCLDRLGVAAGAALFVGDSTVDQQCAKNAGVAFAFFASGYDDGVNADAASLVFRDHALLHDSIVRATASTQRARP